MPGKPPVAPGIRGEEQYRIRWSNVSMSGGGVARMCIGERKLKLFGFIPFWWPVMNSRWHQAEELADDDIEDDRRLRAPLPQPKYR